MANDADLDFRRFLRSTATAMEPDEALRARPGTLIGVDAAAENALALIDITSIFDLSVSRVFAAAAGLLALQQDATAVEARLNVIASDVAAAPPGVPVSELANQPLAILRGIGEAIAPALAAALDVVTVRDLALWPPYRAAKSILTVAFFPDEEQAFDPEAPPELLPKAGVYPTERVFFKKLVIDVVGEPAQGGQPIEHAGPIDLATALAAPTGFERLATGALLTFSQSWFSQGLTLGSLLHSTSLAPGESTRIAVVDWSRRSRAAASEDISESELLSNTMTHSRAISEVTNATATEFQSGRSQTSSTSSTDQSGAGGGLELGPLAIGGSAATSTTTTDVMSASSSFGARDLAASYAQQINDRSQQNAASVRNRRASIVREVSQSEHEQISTRVVTNYNHMHALSIHYYEVVQAFRTTTQLERAERCLFVPVKLVDFRNAALIDRWRLRLAAGALTERTRRQLTVEYGVVEIIPQTPRVRPGDVVVGGTIGGALVGTKIARTAIAASALSNVTASAAGTTSTNTGGDAAGGAAGTSSGGSSSGSGVAGGGPAGTGAPPPVVIDYQRAPLNAPATILALKGWNIEQLNRIGWATGRVLMQAGSDSVFVSDDALLIGFSLRDAQAARFVVRTHSGQEITPAATTGSTFSLAAPLAISELDSIAVQFTGTQDVHTALVLQLNLFGTVMPLDIPIVLRPMSVPLDVVKLGSVAPARELMDHLEANRLHYTQVILRMLDAATVAALLSRYTYRTLPLGQLVDPQPIAVMANFLVFKMNVETGGEPDDPRWAEEQATWQKWLVRRGLDRPAPRSEIIPLPSGGLFAEAVLGRYNAAEKMDLKRFWNWQDSPIPITAPEIAAVQAGSRAQSEQIAPGQLGAPVLGIQAPTTLPDAAGIAAIISAVQNGNMFRDMSGMAQTAAVAQAALQASAAGATAVGAQAGQNLKTVMDNNTERMRIAAQLLTGGAAGGGGCGSGSRPAGNVTEEGARLNYARDLDARGGGAAPGTTARGGSSGAPPPTAQTAQFQSSKQVTPPQNVEGDLFNRQTGGAAADLASKVADAIDKEETGGGGGAAPISPFPAKPFVPLSRATSTRLGTLNAAFASALGASPLDPRSPNIKDLRDLPIAIVALDSNGARPLTGQLHANMYFSASLLKVAALYAAHQLRVAVNDLAANLDIKKVTKPAQVFAEVAKAFNSQIENRIPLINQPKWGVPKRLKIPTYDAIFNATQEDGHWVLDFHQTNHIEAPSAKLGASFATHLNRMIVGSHDDSAGVCIRSLGYMWINGVLEAAGFLDLNQTDHEGIWLAGDYGFEPTVSLNSVNDGPVKQATTCYHMASLFTELADKNLVRNIPNPIGGRTGNEEMLDLLGLAVTDSHARTRFLDNSVPPPFAIQQSKIGVGKLKVDPRNPSVPPTCDPVPGNPVVHGCVTSEAAILVHTSGRKYVAVYQNVLDGGSTEFERITAFIQRVMDADHP